MMNEEAQGSACNLYEEHFVHAGGALSGQAIQLLSLAKKQIALLGFAGMALVLKLSNACCASAIPSLTGRKTAAAQSYR